MATFNEDMVTRWIATHFDVEPGAEPTRATFTGAVFGIADTGGRNVHINWDAKNQTIAWELLENPNKYSFGPLASGESTIKTVVADINAALTP